MSAPMLQFDVTLDDSEIAELAALPESAWFRSVHFENFDSPQSANLARMEGRQRGVKVALVDKWMAQVVAGATVLDTFCANGQYSFAAAKHGASAVTGVEFDDDRVAAATAVYNILRKRQPGPPIEFRHGDVYDLPRITPGPYDVALCLGGLYHIADPAYVLRQIRAVTTGWLIVQTSSILRGRKNQAMFRVRADATGKGLTAIVGGSGKWDMTAECFRQLLKHGGFEVVDEHPEPPLYYALCKAV